MKKLSYSFSTTIILLLATLPGCTVIAAADAVGSAAIGVVSTAASVTGSIVGGAYDLATGNDEDDENKKKSED